MAYGLFLRKTERTANLPISPELMEKTNKEGAFAGLSQIKTKQYLLRSEKRPLPTKKVITCVSPLKLKPRAELRKHLDGLCRIVAYTSTFLECRSQKQY